MNPPDPNADRKLDGRLMRGLLATVTAAFVWILLPFYGTILWAAIIALLTLLAARLVAILPLALVAGALAREATGLYRRLQSGEFNPVLCLRGVFDALPDAVTTLLDRAGLIDFDTLQRRLVAALSQASQFIAAQALGIGQNTFEWVASLFIALYLAFFLIRDGQALNLSSNSCACTGVSGTARRSDNTSACPSRIRKKAR